jgi:uracil-DNA glycosylase
MQKAMVERLKSLQRAGVTHVKRVSRRSSPPRGEDAAGTTAAVEEQRGRRRFAAETPTTRANLAPENRLRPHTIAVTERSAASESADPRCAALAALAHEVAACTRCAELARTRTQTVFGVGNPHARLVFCGEAPGADEDRLGEPFVGRAGQLLNDIIVKGMKMRREDVYILNILRCRPPGNRTPLPVEAAACREYLDRQLAIIRPEFICCLGAVAAQNLLGTDATIGRLRGRVHDYQGIKVVCTYHPAYVLRNPQAKRPVWDDIQLLMAEMNTRAEGGGRRAEDSL